MARRGKKCPVCELNIRTVDYKNEQFMSRFLTDRGKILPRRITGACARHQRQIGTSLKRARYLALVPYMASSEA
ncbi:MAG: 30S ribosomal protein S18 [Longimicrobiaceae bacterium]